MARKDLGPLTIALTKNAGINVKANGFTLIELLVTLAVVIILATIAVPGFQNLIANNREASTENAIRSGLKLARSEAIKRREQVSLMKDTDDALQVWLKDEALRKVNLIKQASLTLPDGAITFTSLGRLAENSGNSLCVTLDGGGSRYFELSQAGGLTVLNVDSCDE